MKSLTVVGAVVLTSPLSPAHADGQYGDIKPGAVLRHVEHLSESSDKGWTMSASADGRTVAVGGLAYNADGSTLGHVDVWVLTTAGWMLQADLSSPVSGFSDDYFGAAVSLSSDGQHLAVGDFYEKSASGEQSWRGKVFAYARTGADWSSPTPMESPDQGYDSAFGSSVALNADGSELIVGAPYKAEANSRVTGAAWAFTHTAAGWGKAQPVAPAAGQYQAIYGQHVAISADGRLAAVSNAFAVVGRKPSAGDVIVFARASNDSWKQTSVLADQHPMESARFGTSVAMSADGSTIAVGTTATNGWDDPGARVLVYRRTGPGWTRSATFRYNSDTFNNYSEFGFSVALSSTGDVVAVGAPYRPRGSLANVGGVYRYRWTGSAWSYLGPTFVRDAGQDEYVGSALALSADADRLFIGAGGYRRPGAHPSQTGATYVVE